MFFGASSDERFQPNQERLKQISPETYRYESNAEQIEAQIKARITKPGQEKEESNSDPQQPRLL